jgi:hypothetical protein
VKTPSRSTLSPRERALIIYLFAWREGAFSSASESAIEVSDQVADVFKAH